ncbi:MAG: hypothetical protein CVU77_08070, partial [Elusimicrobia bacterium HGW-Elusimicrobia-1]
MTGRIIKALSVQLLGFALLAAPLSAAVRLKTVEFNFGIGSSTGVVSGATLQYPAINFRLPDAVAVKKAWLEFDGLHEGGNNINFTGLDILFDQSVAASSVRDIFPDSIIFYGSGDESVRFHAKCDIPLAVFAGVTTAKNYAAAVKPTASSAGSIYNMPALKLYVTYEYDDTATIQVNTVRFPLKSNWNNSVASAQGAVAPGTAAFDYEARVAESGSADFAVVSHWFEVTGHRLSGGATADGSVRARIGAGSWSPSAALDGSQIDSYDFVYLTQPSTGTGLVFNTRQTLNVETTQNTIYNLGGECVVTYEFSRDASVKTKTVYYLLGQGLTPGADFQFPSVALNMEETGVDLKALYARVTGNYNGTSVGNVIWNYSLNNSSGTPQTYSHITQALQIGGHPFLLDMWSVFASTSWANGARLAASYYPDNATNTGPQSAEVIVTYQYTSAAKFTDSHRALAYQAATGLITSHSENFTVFNSTVETSEGRKSRNSAYIAGNFLAHRNNNTIVTDYSIGQNVAPASDETHTPRTTAEACYTTALYTDTLALITTSPVTLTANVSVSLNQIWPSAVYILTHSYFPAPLTPTYLAQYKSDGTTAISTGGWTNSPSMVLKLNMASRIADTLTPIFEVKTITSAFNGADLSTGSAVNFGGSGVAAGSVAVSGLADGGRYHWRARVASPNGVSSWASFGGNADGTIDFGRDVSSPSVAQVSPPDGDVSSSTARSFQWTGTEYPADANSAIGNYLLIVASSTDFTTILYSSSTASQQASAVLPQRAYYWKVRAEDNAGNVGSYTGAWSVTVDTTPPPAVSALNGPLNGLTTGQNILTFSWDGVTDAPAGVSRYHLQLS